MKHGRSCNRNYKIDEKSVPDGSIAISVLVAGSACVDYSSFGSQQMAAGPTAIFLLLLLRMVLEYRPMIFLHENVIGFVISLLEDVLSPIYRLEESIIASEAMSFPVERRRKYCIARLNDNFKFPGLILPHFFLFESVVCLSLM